MGKQGQYVGDGLHGTCNRKVSHLKRIYALSIVCVQSEIIGEFCRHVWEKCALPGDGS